MRPLGLDHNFAKYWPCDGRARPPGNSSIAIGTCDHSIGGSYGQGPSALFCPLYFVIALALLIWLQAESPSATIPEITNVRRQPVASAAHENPVSRLSLVAQLRTQHPGESRPEGAQPQRIGGILATLLDNIQS